MELELFLKEKISALKMEGHTIFLFRKDGSTAFVQNGLALHQASIGALLAGMWQAAELLISYLPSEADREGFRLAHDTTDQGIYILPMGRDYFLAIIYSEVVNPGQIKMQSRKLAEVISDFIFERPSIPIEKKEFVFQDISDAEIDHLFSKARNGQCL